MSHATMRLVFVLVVHCVCLHAEGRAEERFVNIGPRNMWIDCIGDASRTPTVILIAGGGRTASDWDGIAPAVGKFARVCRFDIAGFGRSDQPPKRQSADDIVHDLHALLHAASEKPPYILVGHSVGGLHARRYATRFPDEIAGFVFVDSAHEEQAWRLHAIYPAGGALDDITASTGFLIKPGERLTWRTEVPLIVLARGRTVPRETVPELTDEQFTASERAWQTLQKDLSTRSAEGQIRRAENSGHFIHWYEPNLVIDAIRDLCSAASISR